MKRRRMASVGIPLLAAACALALLIWGNYRYCEANPGGNDFLVNWMSTRLFFWEGTSPYSDEAAIKIQNLAYGRTAYPDEDQLRVAYPLFSTLIFLPFSAIKNFVLARALWMTILEIALASLSWISIRLTRWKVDLLVLGLFLLFSLSWYHGVRPLINGNVVILIALFFAGALLAYKNRLDELAGILMAFTAIKPQLALLLAFYLVYYSITQKRWGYIFWYFGTLTLLILLSFLLLPDWLIQNLREVIRYPEYNPPGTLQTALRIWFPGFGERLGIGISGLLMVLLIVEWYFSRKYNSRLFIWCSSLTLTISQWIGIQTNPDNFIILMPALVLIFSIITNKWRKSGMFVSTTIMAILLAGLWYLSLENLGGGSRLQQSTILFLPIPGLLLVGLYWIRWWVGQPTNYLEDWTSI